MNSKTKQILTKFITRQHISEHHVASYNKLISQQIPEFIKQNQNYILFEIAQKDKTYKYYLKISNPVLLEPQVKQYNSLITKLNPIDCLIRNLSYTSKLCIYLCLHRTDTQTGKSQIINKKTN